MDAALLLARRDGAIGFEGAGDFFLDDDGRLTVPRRRGRPRPFAYMGVHIAKPRLVDDGPRRPLLPRADLWRALGRRRAACTAACWTATGCTSAIPQARDEAEARLAGAGMTRPVRSLRRPPGPRWFTIPAHRPFLEDLAAGVLDWLGDHPPEALSDAVILLPNRRAAARLRRRLRRSRPAAGRCCCRRSGRWATWTRTSRRSSPATWPSTCRPPSRP